jgi:hypothetical protein
VSALDPAAAEITLAARTSADRAVADARLGLVADAAGAVGVFGLATLGLMFAIEVPAGGPYRFGAANDLSGSVFAVLLVPVVVGLERRLPPARRSRELAFAAIAASAAAAVMPVLLVTGRLAFEVETPLVVLAFIVQSAWLYAAGRRMRGVAGFPPRLARLSEGVGASFVAGIAIAGVSLVLPSGSLPQLMIGGIGISLAVAGWLGWPVWFLALGRVLRASR